MSAARQPVVCGAAIVALVWCAHRAAGQVVFTDVAAARGILPYSMTNGMGGGAALADFDNDGDVDIFVPTGPGTPDQFYRNLGNGFFTEIAAAAGLASTNANRVALWIDYDGDHDLDLFVANDVTAAPTSYRLYRQETGGIFTDVTVAAGLFIPPANPGQHQRGGVCAGDINNDRYLDIVAAVWNGPIHLFLNNRDGTFANISVSSGVGVTWQYAHQPVMADFNRDGWLDVFVAVDFAPNLLFINNRNNTFTNQAAAAGVATAMNEMGVSLGDFDADGDLDIYVTNIFGTDPNTLQPEYNLLFKNTTVGQTASFVNVSQLPGGNVSDGGWGWGATFFDFDNNGTLDIGTTNGWRSGPWISDATRLFSNTGGNPPQFTNVAAATGFADTFYGSNLVSFDFDLDGDLDVFQTCQAIPDISQPSRLRLLLNNATTNGNHRLLVRPRVNGPNHQAIGAIVRATVPGLSMMRPVTSGISYDGQEPAEAAFGLGTNTLVSTLTVEWPDGSISTLNDVPADQVLTIQHGGFGDLDADNDIDTADVNFFTSCYTGPGPGNGVVLYSAACRPADMNGDGDVDCDDWHVQSDAFAEDSGSAPVPEMEVFLSTLLGPSPEPLPACLSDLDYDGQVNGRDVSVFVAAVCGP